MVLSRAKATPVVWIGLLHRLKRRGAPIESLEKRAAITYAILLAGFWSIDLMLYPGTPTGIRSVISGFTWLLTIPLLALCAGGLVWLFIMLVSEVLKAKPKPNRYPVSSNQQADRDEVERLRRSAEAETQKQKEAERIGEHERRIAKAAEEGARFHLVKQTRSASEAAKASLEEF